MAIIEELLKKKLNLTIKQAKNIMKRMTIREATIAINNPMLYGKRWSLYSSHDTKKEAQDRAKTLRKVYKSSRVRLIPAKAKLRFDIDMLRVNGRLSGHRKWGAYVLK